MLQASARRPGTERRRTYGRRQGHRLSARQQCLIDTRLPALRPAPDDPALARPAELFGFSPRAIWLEIGFGAGEHLIWQAKANRDVGIIGCEPFINGVAKLLSAIETERLDNIRIHDGDARDLLDGIGEGTIDRVFLLFPDPWPKTRHNKRRLVNTETLGALARVMADGAEFRFASDIGDYVDWTLRHLRVSREFAWCAERASDWRVRPDDWPRTRYESKAAAEGRSSAYLRFIRIPR